MILASLATMSCLMTLARANPLAFNTYRRRELPVDEGAELVLLYDQKGFENPDPSVRSFYDFGRVYANEVSLFDRPELSGIATNDVGRSENGVALEHGTRGATGAKKRAIGSLSIVNPVDVLRSRVLLELARRRAQQLELQAQANRRLLQSVGKRSIRQYGDGVYSATSAIGSLNDNNEAATYAKTVRDETKRDYEGQRDPVASSMRSRDWYEPEEVITTRENTRDDNNARKVASTYRQDRI